MKKYPVERWHEKAISEMNMILVNYFLAPKNFDGWLLSHKLFEQLPANAQNTIYFFRRKMENNDEAIRIDIIESDSIKLAEQSFLSMLTDVMAPMEFPEADDNVSVGVICYKGFSDIDSLLMFLRGNLIIRVRSVGQKEIPVLDEAKKIDADIISEPERNDAKLISELKIDFSASLNEVLNQLALNKESYSGKKVYYKIIAQDHKIELTRNSIISYESNIPNKIILYVINEEGSVSRVQLK